MFAMTKIVVLVSSVLIPVADISPGRLIGPDMSVATEKNISDVAVPLPSGTVNWDWLTHSGR